jgi:hypothetical protein
MTGFNIHCPPGFVDRAYLVFLVSLHTTHRTADYDGSESLSPPLRVRVCGPGFAAGVRAPGRRMRPTAEGYITSSPGECSGGHWRRRWECVIVAPTARCFRPRPPGGACPLLLAGPAGPHPVSTSPVEQVACQCHVAVMRYERRACNLLPDHRLRGQVVVGRRFEPQAAQASCHLSGNGKSPSNRLLDRCATRGWRLCYVVGTALGGDS